MSLLSRRPREKDTRAIVFDARPPSGRDSAIAAHEALWGKPMPLAPSEEEAAERVIQYLRESEVMPPDRQDETSPKPDTKTLSATEGDRLDQIATLMRLLTYGEMMDLAAAIWKARPADADGAISLKLETLPGTLHRWSAKEDSKP